MEKAKVSVSNDKIKLTNYNKYQKLTVPSRNSNITKELNYHDVIVLGLAHDTNPTNPRKGVVFLDVEHNPQYCSICISKTKEENRKKVIQKLEGLVPGVTNYDLFSVLPEVAKEVLYNALEGDNEAINVIKDKKEFFKKAVEVLNEINTLDKTKIKECEYVYYEVMKSKEADEIISKVLEAFDRIDMLKKEYEKVKYVNQIVEDSGKTRTIYIFNDGRAYAKKQKLDRTQVHYHDHSDFNKFPVTSGFYDTVDWVDVENLVVPIEWFKERLEEYNRIKEELKDALKEHTELDKKHSKLLEKANIKYMDKEEEYNRKKEKLIEELHKCW